MKKGKSPAKLPRPKTLSDSLAVSQSGRKLVREAWDFRNVPQDEIEPCYLYEYSRQSPLIIEEVTATLKRGPYLESAAYKKRRSDWFKSNPEPAEEADRE